MIEVIAVSTGGEQPPVVREFCVYDNSDVLGVALKAAAESAIRYSQGEAVYESFEAIEASQKRAALYLAARLRSLDDFENPAGYTSMRYEAAEIYAGFMFGLGQLFPGTTQPTPPLGGWHASQPLDLLLGSVRHRLLKPTEYQARIDADTNPYDEAAFYNRYLPLTLRDVRR